MKTICVLGDASNARWLIPLYDEIVAIEYGHQLPTDRTPMCDLLVFTGGQDLQPSMYGKDYSFIIGSKIRDEWETTWYKWAVKNKVPMFGICRGMQLFTALTGGTLIPDVGGHYGNHPVYTNSFTSLSHEFSKFQVNSIHHQMCVPDKRKTKLLAWARDIALKGQAEPEALWFPEVRALGVQWHPELMDDQTTATQLTLKWVKEYLI